MTEARGPFVIVVASEKGGVGKTTLATNLAVYLKALRDELPVTIASFDNHFSVDNMFALGDRRGGSVTELLGGTDPAGLAALGEYGVQYLRSARSLVPPDDDIGRLGRLLADATLPGLLILDTRPVLDYFTRSALRAADLVLVPVKDRPSLIDAASLRRTLREDGGDPQRVWLVPSLIDERLRLKGTVGIRDFLVCSARERGYQVVETFIAKNAKVESLVSGFSSRIHPVLTHARDTQVHRQFQELAEFVLKRFEASEQPAADAGPPPVPLPRSGGRPFAECPLCHAMAGGDGRYFQDPRSRRRGFFHADCLVRLFDGSELWPSETTAGGVAIIPAAEDGFAVFLFDADGAMLASERIGDAHDGALETCWRQATGRPSATFYRDVLLISLGAFDPASFARWRRLVFRELRELI